MHLEEVTLPGRCVRLEPLRRAHVDELLPAASEQDLWAFMGVRGFTREGLERWVRARVAASEKGCALAFVQRDARSREAIGSTSLFDADFANRRIEIGHTWIGRAHRRSGVNTEAKLLLLTHAFEVLGFDRVQLKTDVGNLRSQAAIARLGAVREGILRRYVVDEEGVGHDRVMFSVIREEWPRVRSRLEGFAEEAPPGRHPERGQAGS